MIGSVAVIKRALLCVAVAMIAALAVAYASTAVDKEKTRIVDVDRVVIPLHIEQGNTAPLQTLIDQQAQDDDRSVFDQLAASGAGITSMRFKTSARGGELTIPMMRVTVNSPAFSLTFRPGDDYTEYVPSNEWRIFNNNGLAFFNVTTDSPKGCDFVVDITYVKGAKVVDPNP